MRVRLSLPASWAWVCSYRCFTSHKAVTLTHRHCLVHHHLKLAALLLLGLSLEGSNVGKFVNILTLIIGGVILADLVSHGTQTVGILKGVNGLWTSSVNGMLGKTS